MKESKAKWTETTLGAICEKPQYGWTSKSARHGNIKYLRTTDLSSGRVNWDSVPFCQEEPENIEKYILKDNDIVVSRAGSVGLSYRIESPPKNSVFASYLIRLRPGNTVEPKYVEYFLKSPDYWKQISDAAAGIAVQNINATKLSNVRIPMCPLPDQKRIVAKLDTLFGHLDQLRSRLDKIPVLLNQFRQAVLTQAVTGKLTEEWRRENPNETSYALINALQEAHLTNGGHKKGNAAPPTEGVHNLTKNGLPSSWSVAELKDLCTPDSPITYGILMPGPEQKDGVPYIRVADFPNDTLNLSTIRRTSPAIACEFQRSTLRAGDILLSIRGTVGRICRIPAELDGANITQDSARLRIQTDINADYIMWYLRSPEAQGRMTKATKGVAVRGINIGDVRAFQVAIPPISEQHEIVRRMETLIQILENVESHYETLKKRMAGLPQQILSKIFQTGLPAMPKGEEFLNSLQLRDNK